MQRPSDLPNEAARLAELRTYEVLDTEPEPAFDALTKLVASILQVPIALVSLIDEDRQWFKSRHGLEATETPRDVSFCGHVVATGTVLIVRDAWADPRFADNPLVTGEPRVRFYAGIPLRMRTGFDLGTLCAIDHEPRDPTPQQLEQLSLFATLVVEQLESRRKVAVLERIVNSVPGMLAFWDSQERCQFANAAYERWFAVKPETMRSGVTLAALLGPIYAQNKPYIQGALQGEPQIFEREIPDPAGGPPRYSQAEYVPHVANGHVDGFSVMVTDISARKRLEDELRLSESRLRAVLDAMEEGVVLQVASSEIVASNPAAETLLGMTHDQLLGKSSLDPRWRSIHEDGSPFLGETHPSMVTLHTGQPQSNVVMGVHKPSGELTWLSINSRPLANPGHGNLPRGVVCTFRDVTEERLAAERAARLTRQERLVTTGTLAAGVGHEINNPLTFVMGNLDYALEEIREIAGGSPSVQLQELIEMLGEARSGAERIRKIVRGLRALAQDAGPAVPTDARTCVEMGVNMAMHELRRRATLKVELPRLPLVLADESRLTQVLVNLLVNAAQAFATDDPERNRVTIAAASALDCVTLTVTDNGPGIRPDVLPRIFDPFFTTKPIGEGTGLGLSISHSIVVELGGELRCKTTLHEGTTFEVQLPRARQSDADARNSTTAPIAVRGRVLLIDDEEAVVRVLERMLRHEHEVVATTDPREALRRLTSGEVFDVIFCDLMMPYLTGAEVHRRVAEIKPELAARFVFLSGGVVNPDMALFLANVPNERFDKPLGIQTLRSAVRRFLA